MYINQLDKPAVSMQTDISQVKTPRLFIPDHSSPAGCVRGITFKVHLNLPHLLASTRARIDREDGSISLKARQVRGQTSGRCQKLTINKKEKKTSKECGHIYVSKLSRLHGWKSSNKHSKNVQTALPVLGQGSSAASL